MQQKNCHHCNTFHPFTSEFWYDRKNWFECRIKRRAINLKYERQPHVAKIKSEQHKKQYYANPEPYRQAAKLRQSSSKAKFRVLRGNAESRNIEVGLTFEEYCAIVSNPCFYCGSSLPQYGGGVDRLESTLPYSVSNCVAACTRCNIAKHVMGYNEFMDWIKLLYTRHCLASKEA